MLIRRRLTALVALMILPMVAPAADISGTWKASCDTSIGKQEYTYTFAVKEGTLTGKLISADEIRYSRDVSGMAHAEVVARRAQ